MMILYLSLLWLCFQIKAVSCNCSGVVTTLTAVYDSVGELTTENYPTGYYSSSNCRWLIQAADSSQKIVIYFKDFQTEMAFDTLTIYDGDSDAAEVIFSGSGDHTYIWMISSSNSLYVYFQSDYSVEATGIKIQYISADSDVEASSSTCLDPPITAHVSKTQLSTIDYGYSCSYHITTSAGRKIQFSVLIDDHSQLTVYDGSSSSGVQIVEYHTTFIDTNVYQSIDSEIFVHKPRGSFVMYFISVDATATAPPIATQTSPPPRTECSLYHLVATFSNGYVMSPGYPNTYPHNYHCYMTITASDLSKSVKFKFLDVDLQSCCDYIEIFDGTDSSFTSFGNVWLVGDEGTSSGASIHIVFDSDTTGSQRGFALEYTEVERAIPDCRPDNYQQLQFNISNEHIITSPNYPGNYDDETLQYWLIIKPNGTDNLVLDIWDIHIESSTDCQFDWIKIYDGACTSSPLLDIICGSEPRLIQDATGLYVLIEFSSDYSVTYKGFEMKVYLGDHVGGDDHDDDGADDGPNRLYLIGVFIPIVIVIIAVVVGCFMYHNWRKNAFIKPTHTEPVPKPVPPVYQRITTHKLLCDLHLQSAQMQQQKIHKPKRKTKTQYDSQQPGPSGVSTVTPGPHVNEPPPPYSINTRDPAFPPSVYAPLPNQTPTPGLVPMAGFAPTAVPPGAMINQNLASVPRAYPYLTPAEARMAGLYG